MHNKSYSSCPKKLDARRNTIIKPYQNIFQQTSLPISKQYWSLSATCINESGKLIPGTELHQIITEKFIKPNQFFGVDSNKETVNKNIPYKDSTWYNNDFLKAMESHICNNKYFNPGIVNCDFIGTPKTNAKTFSSIFSLISTRKVKDVIITGNFVLKSRFIKTKIDPQDIIKELNANDNFITEYENNWNMLDNFYVYNGTGKSATKMCSIILYRKNES